MINLYDILKTVLTESVSSDKVVQAIDNKTRVLIKYNDEKSSAPGVRLIEPYAYGVSTAGNEVLRAFQYEGDTLRGVPKWKLFRLDRVSMWKPTKSHFIAEPNEYIPSAEEFNQNGDKSMESVLSLVDLDYDRTSNNPYEKGSDLYKLRKQTDAMSKSQPINIQDYKDMNDDDVQNSSTSNMGPVTSQLSPSSLDTSADSGPEYNNQLINNNTAIDTNSAEFQDMLKRNLAITDKEKKKRGFSLH